MTDEEFAFFLCTHAWIFDRTDGSTIAPALRFRADGRFENSPHPNETFWQITDGKLEFLNPGGAVTTRFAAVEGSDSIAMRLEGQFLAVPQPEIIHTLIARPIRPAGHVAGRPRVATMIRTHVVNAKLWDIFYALQDSPLYDLYVLADESKGPIVLPGISVIAHTVLTCRNLDLYTEIPSVLWKCGDFPIYCAWAQLPDYDYYIQIEFDVHMVRPNPLFVEGVINRLLCDSGSPVDLVAPYLGSADPHWMWHEAAARVYPQVYGSFFPFVVLSNRAVVHLLAERRREARRTPAEPDVMHCEAFCPSALVAAGDFKCISLDELLPGCIQRETFRISLPSEFLLGAHVTNDPRVEMLHPVLDAASYLERVLQRAGDEDGVKQFIAHLEQLEPGVIDHRLRTKFVERAALKFNPAIV